MRMGLLALLVGLAVAGCAGTREAELPEGPFQIVLIATTDMQGELEPCG